ncbi:MAG TPA: efflux RND transporter periplasmic adaptor subunit [Steroidobacteraceae bacterium]|nr:efflux RND transporter periplasmic adaptor subunit [Steroidobacteraceae bacterium]
MRSKRVQLGLAVAVAIVVATLVWLRVTRARSAAQERRGPSAVAVYAAQARRMDVPIYLDGLGTVQAFYTANITAQIDGELLSTDFVEGQMVKKGELLAQIDPRPSQAALAGAIAVKAKDRAQLAGAQDVLNQYEELAPANLTSKQSLDSQRALVQQLQAQIQVDQAAIDTARTQLAYTRITSPISGRTGIRTIDPGNIVHAAGTNPIVVVTQVQPISVVFTLPEQDLAEVRLALGGGPIHVTAIARDGEREQLDQGTVTLIDNQIDQTTGTMRLKASFPNLHSTLWPGQFVAIRMHLRTEHDVVTIPSSALQRGPDGLFTYVIMPDSVVQVRALKIDREANGADGVSVVDAGLQSGERVVTSNQLRLRPGARVLVIRRAAHSAI